MDISDRYGSVERLDVLGCSGDVGGVYPTCRTALEAALALSWLTLMGLSGGGVVPEGSRSASPGGRASVISTALTLLEKLGNLPLRCLPQPTGAG